MTDITDCILRETARISAELSRISAELDATIFMVDDVAERGMLSRLQRLTHDTALAFAMGRKADIVCSG